jgi:hypothetical protein
MAISDPATCLDPYFVSFEAARRFADVGGGKTRLILH